MKNSFAGRLGAIAVVALALTAAANASAPAGRYMASGTGTVYDTKTKLTWQQPAPLTTYAWAPAKTYCAGLAATLGGTGWRLPTVKELQTIVDYSQFDPPLIDLAAFPGTQATFFWSATPLSGTTVAWDVSFTNGNTFTNDTSDSSTSVRCVR